jgi:hypothetical protein
VPRIRRVKQYIQSSGRIEILRGSIQWRPKNFFSTMPHSPFPDDPILLNSPYRIQSAVGLGALQLFLAALQGDPPKLMKDNMNDLFLLCEEFGFAALLSEVSDFRSKFTAADEEARKRTGDVEE